MTFDPNRMFQEEHGGAPPSQTSHAIAQMQEAIQQENYQNQHDRIPENYQENILGQPAEADNDEYADFIEEDEVAPKPKPKGKRHNDSKKRLTELQEKIERERIEKEQALIRAEIAEREQKRLKDEMEFAFLAHEKIKLDQEKQKLADIWKLANEEGDLDTILVANKELNELNQLEEHYEQELNSVKDRYQKYQEQENQEQSELMELEQKQQMALQEFADARELNSPLLDGFLKHHDFLNPYSHNYDAYLVDRVTPIKNDLIQELKLNGQYDEIGTNGYFTELARRIQQNLNPRFKRKEASMNDPRFQEPNYGQIQQELDQNYRQPSYPQQQGYYQQQPQYNAPQQYQQQNYQYQQPQQPQYAPPYAQNGYQQPSYVAPVNRAGYNTNYHNDPSTMALDEYQQTAADLFSGTLNELSKEVYGRSMDRSEVHDLYKRGLANQYARTR